MSNPHTPSPVYFGGSRKYPLTAGSCNLVFAVISAVEKHNHKIHVGCQFGADQAVIMSACKSSLVVFAVAPSIALAPAHVQHAAQHGALVVASAGGTSAPMPARYILRSIAAIEGCSHAVFFAPGSGSLAVARECVKSGLQVFAFQQQAPAPIPSTAGEWQFSSIYGFSCWQWASAQQSLF